MSSPLSIKFILFPTEKKGSENPLLVQWGGGGSFNFCTTLLPQSCSCINKVIHLTSHVDGCCDSKLILVLNFLTRPVVVLLPCAETPNPKCKSSLFQVGLVLTCYK